MAISHRAFFTTIARRTAMYKRFSVVTLIWVLGLVCTPSAHAAPVLGVPYHVFNLLNRMCLDVDGHSNAKGANLLLGDCSTADYWYFVPVFYFSSTFSLSMAYEIQNARTGLCANVQGASKVDTTFVIQWTCDSGAKNTLWKYSSQTVPSPIPGLWPVTLNRIYDVNSNKPMAVGIVVDWFTVIPYVDIDQTAEQSDLWALKTD